MTKKSLIYAILATLLLLASSGISHATITEAQVRHAWSEVCRIIEMQPLPLSIKDDKVPNAWVTAGQSVTVTTGLMSLLVREEEIFGVLSHEAGHAALKHYEKRVNNAMGVGVAGALLGSLLGNNSLGNVVVGMGSNLATAGFSREQEVAADDFAVDVAFLGEKDPTGIYTALKRLSLYGGKTEPSGFNSHPPDDRRLQHVMDRIRDRNPNIYFPPVE